MDKLRIFAGLHRYSSEGWDVRMFVADRGVGMDRDLAPELSHAGLLLAFGSGSERPLVVSRHMPLFGEEVPFPDISSGGGLFMTAAEDDLELEDLDILSTLIFAEDTRTATASPRIHRAADLFRQVLADAFHTAD